MREILDSYVNNSFGLPLQSESKIRHFEYNYRHLFPENLNAKMLDIGVGLGEMLTCMRDWGYQDYIGIDISPSTINFCKSLGLNCQQVEDSANFLLEHSQQYDVITLLDVLEHIKKEDVINFLKALQTALRPGGLLIIQVPNLQSPDGYLHRYNDITHEFGYIEHSLAQVLITAGFKNFQFKGFEEFVIGSARENKLKLFRSIYWYFVHKLREINGNINPKILNPVFSAFVLKE